MKKILLFFTLVGAILCVGNTSCNKSEPINPFDCDSLYWEIIDIKVLSKAQFLDSICNADPNIAEAAKEVATTISDNVQYKIVTLRYAADYNYDNVYAGHRIVGYASLILPEGVNIANNRVILANESSYIRTIFISYKFGTEAILALKQPMIVPMRAYMITGGIADTSYPFLCKYISNVLALNSIFASQKILKDKNVNQNADLYSDKISVINVGYSRGAYEALALQKYIETEATIEEKSAIDLVGTICGGGIYNISNYIETILSKETYCYPHYMLRIKDSFLSTLHFSQLDYMTHDENIEFFRDENYLSKDLARFMLFNQLYVWSEERIVNEIAKMVNNDFSRERIFSEKLLDKNGFLYQTLLNESANEDLLGNWQPRIPVTFFHAKNDDCIPFECTRQAQETFEGNPSVSFIIDETPEKQFLHFDMLAKFYEILAKQEL